jgi:alkanesulfonate monooxygenase SsuD/methylene tetrahydromethanopterin reductase-like flavin-dependent oxidoreductase (luciferase family)
VRFGLAYDFANPAPWTLPPAALYAATLDQIAYAERLGFDAVWLAERHLREDGFMPAPPPIAAAVAARTVSIRIGIAVPGLPLHNALLLAEQVAVLDQLSGGRVELAVGAGVSAEEFAAFGVPWRQRAGRFREAVQVLRLLFSGERISFKGRFYDLAGVRLSPPPLQAGGPPLWMSAGNARAASRAAAFRAHLLPHGDRRETVDVWARALRVAGDDPAAYRVLVDRPLLVTDDAAGLWERLRPGERYRAERGAAWPWEAEGLPAAPARNGSYEPLLNGRYIIGTAAQVAEEIAAYRERVPVTDLIAWGAPLGLHPDELYPALARFAREVLPRFR